MLSLLTFQSPPTSAYLPVRFSLVRPSVRPSVHPLVRPSVHPSVRSAICQTVVQSVSYPFVIWPMRSDEI